MNQTINIVLFILLALTLVFCKSSTSSNGSLPGSAFFTISGDFQGSKTGEAIFFLARIGPGETNEFSLHIFNIDYMLQINIQWPGEPELKTGEYALGIGERWIIGSGPGYYTGVSYVIMPEDPANILDATTYETDSEAAGSSGTLVINSFNGDVMSGTFELTAKKWDRNAERHTQDEIRITNGTFTAVFSDIE